MQLTIILPILIGLSKKQYCIREEFSDHIAEDAETGALSGSLVLAATSGNGNQDKPTGSDVKNTSTVIKRFVVDFSSETFRPLMEHEVNGLDYRYVYSDKARLSVVVQGIENGSASLLDDKGELHAYYHCDYLGTTDYLTSAVNSKEKISGGVVRQNYASALP